MSDGNQDLLTLAEAAKLLGRGVHQSTLRRWAHAGLRGVVLETVAVGARRYVTRDALAEFQRQLNRG